MARREPLLARMTNGKLTARERVDMYLDRIRTIDRQGDLNSVLELNPDAKEIARQLDRERKDGKVRGPLHGIPVMLRSVHP